MITFADFIYAKYEMIAGGFPQGFCGQIAEEIQGRLGGEIVAGFLLYGPGMSNKRPHWWVNTGGKIIDPMAEYFNEHIEPCRHQEAHRDLSKKYWTTPLAGPETITPC